jgi:hypothetical protein
MEGLDNNAIAGRNGRQRVEPLKNSRVRLKKPHAPLQRFPEWKGFSAYDQA